MNVKFPVPMILLCALSVACASQRDNFYTLSVLPDDASSVAAAPAVHVLLSVEIPSIVDRAEMVVSSSPSDVQVLDHERWVGSLSDQVRQTLARDIERRRSDVLVGDRGFGQKAMASVVVRVDIVRMSARSVGPVSIEARWRIQNEAEATDDVGGGVFEAPADSGRYGSIAKGYSQAISALADKLAAGIHSSAKSGGVGAL